MLARLILALVLAVAVAPQAAAQNQPFYTAPATGRCLEWTTKLSVGGASALVDSTKVKTFIHGSQTATLIAKADIHDASGGSVSESAWRLGLAVDNTTVYVIINGVSVSWTGFDFPTAGQTVLVAVINTGLAAAASRVRLYVDGVDQGDADAGTPPAQFATIDLQTGKRLTLGNSNLGAGDGSSSIDGLICYGAIRADAPSASDVATLSAALAADDDASPPAPGEPLPGSVLFIGVGEWQASSAPGVPLTPGLAVGHDVNDKTFAAVFASGVASAPTVTFPSAPAGEEWVKLTNGTAFRSEPGLGSCFLEVWQKKGPAPSQAPLVSISDVGQGWSVYLANWRNSPDTVAAVSNTATAASTWVPPSVTTVNPNTRVITFVGSPDVNQLVLATAQGFAERVGGLQWDSGIGPQAVGMADFTQADPGTVQMPLWEQQLNGADPWCGVTVALDLIQEVVPPQPPQGGGTPTLIRELVTGRDLVTGRELVTGSRELP